MDIFNCVFGASRCCSRSRVASPSPLRPTWLVNNERSAVRASDKSILSSTQAASGRLAFTRPIRRLRTAPSQTKIDGSRKPLCKGQSRRHTLTMSFRGGLAEDKRTWVDFLEGAGQLKLLVEPGQPLGGMSYFAKLYCDDDFCRRLLRKFNGNVEKSAEKLQSALVWREQHKDLIISRKYVLGSDERVIGADLEKRPVVYLCLRNQMLPAAQCLDQKTACMLQAVDNMPEGVETAMHIWDLHGQQFRMSDLNLAPLIETVRSMESYFCERLHKVIIIGMPRMAVLLKNAVWPLISESTKRKTKFFSSDEAKQYFSEVCDAEVCGRIIAAMDQNRDDSNSIQQRKRSWLQVNQSGALVPLVPSV